MNHLLPLSKQFLCCEILWNQIDEVQKDYWMKGGPELLSHCFLKRMADFLIDLWLLSKVMYFFVRSGLCCVPLFAL